LDQELLAFVESHPEVKTNYELLISIRGIGMINALMTIAYTENFECFPNARSYAVYVGVVPFDYSSGTSIKGRKRLVLLQIKSLSKNLLKQPEVQYNGIQN